MRSETLTPEQKQALLAAIRRIVDAGCTPFDWETRPDCCSSRCFQDAVIAWAMLLCDGLSARNIGYGRIEASTYIERQTHGNWSWRFHIRGMESKVCGRNETLLAASVALISAVGERAEGTNA